MPILNIPPDDRLGLAILREMPDEVFQSLIIEVNQSAASIPTVKGLSPGDAEQVMDAVNSLARVRAYADVDVEEFASDVCESLVKYEELKPTEGFRFRGRLATLLGIEGLNLAAKAFSLLGEHERLFCSARIITDARPVYGSSVSDPPAAVAITHILKIDYHGAGGHLDEIYIGLGSNDLKELRSVLDRAEGKAKSLQAVFEKSKIKFIDPQRD